MIIYPVDLYGWSYNYPLITGASTSTGNIPSYVVTGKENALYSFYSYLRTQFGLITGNPLPAPTVYDLAYEQATQFPNLTIQDLGAQQSKEWSFAGNASLTTKGRYEQTMVEIMINDMNTVAPTEYDDAELNVRRLRDQLRYLVNGMEQVVDYSGNNYVPPCPLLDHQNADAVTGSYVWFPREDPAAWNEMYLKPAVDQPNLKSYRVTVKLKWFLLEVVNN